MINEEELLKYFADVLNDDNSGFSERLKAAEFLEKYHFGKGYSEEGAGIVIIDDIGE